jgi:hypothetical protein
MDVLITQQVILYLRNEILLITAIFLGMDPTREQWEKIADVVKVRLYE